MAAGNSPDDGTLTAWPDAGDRIAWCPVRVPDDSSDLDGAVVELQLHDDGIFTAEVRIPAHQDA